MADPYAPETGNSFYSDFSTGGRQPLPWEDITKGMTQQQYWDYIGALSGIRGSGFNQGLTTDIPSSVINPITQGYDPNTQFFYGNEFGKADNIFTPQDVFGVQTENQLQRTLLGEQQAAAAAAAASKQGLGSQIGYGLLGAVTGVPGGLIRAGVNALGGLGGQNVTEGGMLPPYYTSGSPEPYVDAFGNRLNPDTGLPYDMVGATIGGGGAAVGGGVTPTKTPTTGTTTGTGEGPGEVSTLDKFVVKESELPGGTIGGTGLTGTGGDILGGGGTKTSTGNEIIQSPKFEVKDTKVTNPAGIPWSTLAWMTNSGYKWDPASNAWVLPKFTVKPDDTGTTTSSTTTSTKTDVKLDVPSTNVDTGVKTDTGTKTGTSTSTTNTYNINLGTGTGTVPDLGSLTGNAITIGGTGTGRDFAKELAASRAALAGEQANLMGMYGGIYQNLLGQTAIPTLASQATGQLATDAAKLQRIQSGVMNAEDIRQAQQAAREAYAARGQVMGQPAIGAEILNREAIRQQRENEARAAFQASMGNVAQAAQLQTGNIFQPISSLVSGTFNPLGAYPQDVYSSNYNAQLARDIAAANNAAAIEAAKYGATAAKQAGTVSALGNIFGNIAGNIDWSKLIGGTSKSS